MCAWPIHAVKFTVFDSCEQERKLRCNAHSFLRIFLFQISNIQYQTSSTTFYFPFHLLPSNQNICVHFCWRENWSHTHSTQNVVHSCVTDTSKATKNNKASRELVSFKTCADDLKICTGYLKSLITNGQQHTFTAAFWIFNMRFCSCFKRLHNGVSGVETERSARRYNRNDK